MIVNTGQSRGMAVLRRVPLSLLLAGVLAGGSACETGATAGSDGGVTSVIAGFYPLRYIAERVGGERVRVSNLTRPGAEPHDLELSARQVAQIHDAGLVVYLAGLQPAVDEVVAAEAPKRAFDVAAVEPLRPAPAGAAEEGGRKAHANEAKDPHVWLDPVRLAAISDALADRLATIDAAHAADFRTRAAVLHADLAALDRAYATGLANCERHDLVTSHTAFGYLADRYHLTQVPITGLAPDEEASPQRVADVAAVAKERGATTIFFETLVSPKLAETIAREIGARAEVLDPIEGLPKGSTDDYLSVMRANLGRLRTALGCG
jgi:zinc transport system substrate-binding protein